MTKKRGRASRTTRRNWRNIIPRGSLTEPRWPAVLKDWQQGPPVTTTGSPGDRPAAPSISPVVTSSSFFGMSAMSGRLLRTVAAANLLHSTATRTSKPAASSPRSRPSPPENSEMTARPRLPIAKPR
ncbi:MAG TPA: hypothetical protein VFE78_37425 [Gemmataceae bacterium]|nr:hypothetical protein [Gemmataceae bacterium]